MSPLYYPPSGASTSTWRDIMEARAKVALGATVRVDYRGRNLADWSVTGAGTFVADYDTGYGLRITCTAVQNKAGVIGPNPAFQKFAKVSGTDKWYVAFRAKFPAVAGTSVFVMGVRDGDLGAGLCNFGIHFTHSATNLIIERGGGGASPVATGIANSAGVWRDLEMWNDGTDLSWRVDNGTIGSTSAAGMSASTMQPFFYAQDVTGWFAEYLYANVTP